MLGRSNSDTTADRGPVGTVARPTFNLFTLINLQFVLYTSDFCFLSFVPLIYFAHLFI